MTTKQFETIREEIKQVAKAAFAVDDNPRAYGGERGVDIKIYTYNGEDGQPRWYGAEIIHDSGWGDEEIPYCGDVPDDAVDVEELATINIGTAPTVDPNNFYWSEDDNDHAIVKDAGNNDRVCTAEDLAAVWDDKYDSLYDRGLNGCMGRQIRQSLRRHVCQ